MAPTYVNRLGYGARLKSTAVGRVRRALKWTMDNWYWLIFWAATVVCVVFFFTLCTILSLGIYHASQAKEQLSIVRFDLATAHMALERIDRSLGSLERDVAKMGSLRFTIPGVTATSYNAVRGQTDDTPTITAYNRRIRPGIHCAISRDLEVDYRLKRGDMIYVPGAPSALPNGLWLVGDRMNKRWTGRIDLLLPLGQPHINLRGVTITVIRR